MATQLYSNEPPQLNVSGHQVNAEIKQKDTPNVLMNGGINRTSSKPADELQKGVFLTEVALNSPKPESPKTTRQLELIKKQEPKNKNQMLPPVKNLSQMADISNRRKLISEEKKRLGDVGRLKKKRKSLLSIPLRSSRKDLSNPLIESIKRTENRLFPKQPSARSSLFDNLSARSGSSVYSLDRVSVKSPLSHRSQKSARSLYSRRELLPPINKSYDEKSVYSPKSQRSYISSVSCSTCKSDTSQKITIIEEKLQRESQARENVQKAIEMIKNKQEQILKSLSKEERELIEKEDFIKDEEETNKQVEKENPLNERLKQTEAELESLKTLMGEFCKNILLYNPRKSAALTPILNQLKEKIPNLVIEDDNLEEYRPKGPTFRTQYTIDHKGSLIFK